MASIELLCLSEDTFRVRKFTKSSRLIPLQLYTFVTLVVSAEETILPTSIKAASLMCARRLKDVEVADMIEEFACLRRVKANRGEL